MESTIVVSNGGDRLIQSSAPSKPLSKAEALALSHLREGISTLLSRWNGLQLAVRNQWGGRDSLQKSHQLAAELVLWLSHQTAPLCVEDLENLLHESMLLSFNTEIEDGSIEKVAEELIIMHEEYLQGSNFSNSASSGNPILS